MSEPDYADRFELSLAAPDGHTAGEWAQAGMQAGPAVGLRLVAAIHRRVLGLRLLPPDAAAQLLGWRIDTETDDAIVLRAEGPLLAGRLAVTRPDPRRVELRTTLTYLRPRARTVWALVQPLHRATSQLLIVLAARQLRVRRDGRPRVEVSRRSRSRR